jgi:hypothetical protein
MKNELANLQTSSIYPVATEDVKTAIEKSLENITSMGTSVKIWNRSNSDVAWNAHVLDHETDTRNLSQVCAEIKRKRDALVEVHFAYKKNILQSQIHDKNAQINSDPLEAQMDTLLGDEQRAQAQMKHESILGCTKDISILKSSYDIIHAKIIEKHGRVDETIFELEEKEYWIRRAFKQSMQDVRQSGSISKGEQILLEQIGIEPIEAQKHIIDYLNAVKEEVYKNNMNIDQDSRTMFFNKMVERFLPCINKKVEKMGLDTSHLYKEE